MLDLPTERITPVENFCHKILLTAFDAFGGESVNPSALVLERVKSDDPNVTVVKRLLPTSYDSAPKALREAIEVERPDFVVMLGQAGGRSGVTPERVAINCMDSTSADNDGVKYTDTAIVPDGKAAYFSTLPIRRLTERLCGEGIFSYVSNSAGTFVCNRVMYEALMITEGTDAKAGFVHIPYIPEQLDGKREGTPSLPLDEAVRAVEIIIKELQGLD